VRLDLYLQKMWGDHHPHNQDREVKSSPKRWKAAATELRPRHGLRTSSSSLAIFATILRASSRVSSLAAAPLQLPRFHSACSISLRTSTPALWHNTADRVIEPCSSATFCWFLALSCRMVSTNAALSVGGSGSQCTSYARNIAVRVASRMRSRPLTLFSSGSAATVVSRLNRAAMIRRAVRILYTVSARQGANLEIGQKGRLFLWRPDNGASLAASNSGSLAMFAAIRRALPNSRIKRKYSELNLF
jgi:hypothetical protein